jgi:hypothetical protein
MSRTTLSDLRSILRGMTEAGTEDWTLGTISFFDNDQLDIILDRHRSDYIHEQMTPRPIVGVGGTSLWYEYEANKANLEQTDGGTAIFYVQDGTGATVGTAEYSADYLRGVIEFSVDRGGSVYYWTGRSYDLNAAAADVWRKKASHYAKSFSFSTDNHTVKRSELYTQAVKMAEMYEGMGGNAVITMQTWRSDTDVI